MNELKNDILLDEWKIIEETFDLDNSLKNETLFSIGNGYIGMRGNFEEGLKDKRYTVEGTYLNGFYDTHQIKYGEKAYAFPEIGQTMLNVLNAKVIKVIVDDEEFNMSESIIQKYRRELDFKEATLKREVVWKTKTGKEVEIKTERLVSFNEKHLAAVRLIVRPLNFDGKIKIVSLIDGDVKNLSAEDDPRVGSGISGRPLKIDEKSAAENRLKMTAMTKNSNFKLLCIVDNIINTEDGYNTNVIEDDYKIGLIYDINANRNKETVLDKYITYATTRDYNENEAENKAVEVLNKATEAGFNRIKEEQGLYLKKFWDMADIEIYGDLFLQQGIRFNMFHILQSVGRDGFTNIAAKGLTGEGYEGHYFWDTEMYIIPLFTYTKPEVARKLLEYRYNTLDKARERARQMSHNKGALYPWRTINGEECSAYYPASTAQYHINADIAYAIKKYFEATGDYEFLVNYGAEILFETARIFADLGHYAEGKGFCIDGVTGPDEYTAVVNNNAYTNIMAKDHLDFAYYVSNLLKEKYENIYYKLKEKIQLDESEIAEWKRAADNMYIPYDERLKIHAQDDTFLNKKVWDFENTPKEKYPLLLNYHPLVIYRHQVCKQADWVLALFLHGEKFDKEQKIRDYEYYEKVTTHDSSLSPCVFSIVACDIGYTEKAYEYFMRTARMDLDDHHGNTKDGIHAANMAGSWMGIVFGFGGFRIYSDKISFKPIIPGHWNKYSFKVNYKGRLIKVTVEKETVSFELIEGQGININFYEKEVELKKSELVKEKMPL
ncbi:glycoside hydrolase family 65 protein [Caloramator mitchellensis]|nr:glycosyl hydrolase family 65 protein [Caloramator mitchellensis]